MLLKKERSISHTVDFDEDTAENRVYVASPTFLICGTFKSMIAYIQKSALFYSIQLSSF